MIDYPYIILVVILSFFSFRYWKTKQRKLFHICSCIVFCFVAFRAPVVGADTWSYVKYFTGKQYYYSLTDNRELETLFLAYNKTIHIFTNDSTIYLFLNALISLAPLYYLIRKYSYNGALSLLLFILLNYYAIYFIALRQILALSFNLWSIIFILEKRKNYLLWFITFSIISYFFHSSSIIVILGYLLAYITPINKKNIYIIGILVSFTIGLFLSKDTYLQIFGYLTNNALMNRLSGYSDIYETDVANSFFGYAKITIISLFIFLTISKEQLNHLLTKIYFFSIIIYNLFYFFPIMYRANVGFNIMLIIVFTWIFGKDYYKKTKLRQIINFSSLTIILALSFSFIEKNIKPDLTDPGRLHPYYYFFENWHNHPSIKRF